MPYQINNANGAYLGEPRTLKNTGREPNYPFRDMYVGQWIEVPMAEEFRVMRSVRNIRRKGIHIQLLQPQPNGNWIALRVK